jgi:hypothetical protein
MAVTSLECFSMSALSDRFAPAWLSIQSWLFPWLAVELGPLTAKQMQLIQTLEIVRIEQFIPDLSGFPGRPPSDRAALARAFVAKAVYDIPTTRALIDRLTSDVSLRRICGWERLSMLPSETVFSRAFAEFAASRLPERVHAALIEKTHKDRLVGHILRDSTAIEARESPAKKKLAPAPDPTQVPTTPEHTDQAHAPVPTQVPTTPAHSDQAHAPVPTQVPTTPAHSNQVPAPVPTQVPTTPAHSDQAPAPVTNAQTPGETQKDRSPLPKKRKRGRPRKGEERPKEPTRLERQVAMTLTELLDDLPIACDVGTKTNSQGHKVSWIGYKLHIDSADGQIPISCILTSASLHDSQVAIPLAAMTATRTTNLYDLMDSGYDAEEIRRYSTRLGHIPIIDVNTRRNLARRAELDAESERRKLLGLEYPEESRYKERTAIERVNGRFKDEFGGRYVRVRGACKVMCHCMFGILALTADQLMRLVT